MKKQLLMSICFMIVASFVVAETKFVCSQNGVSVRASSEKNAEKIGALEYLEEVTVIESSSVKDKIDGIENFWIKIKFKDGTGWVFGANLVNSKEYAQMVNQYDGTWVVEKVYSCKTDNYDFSHDLSSYTVSVEFSGYDGIKNAAMFLIDSEEVSGLYSLINGINLESGEMGGSSSRNSIEIEKDKLWVSNSLSKYTLDYELGDFTGYSYDYSLIMKKK